MLKDGGDTLKDRRVSGDEEDLEKGEEEDRSDSDSVSLKMKSVSFSCLILMGPHSADNMKSIPKESLCCSMLVLAV